MITEVVLFQNMFILNIQKTSMSIKIHNSESWPEQESYALFFIFAFNLHKCSLKPKKKYSDHIHCKICLNVRLIQFNF